MNSSLARLIQQCFDGEPRRYERKFRMDGVPVAHVLCATRAHPWGFREAYPQRRVTSLYLDTPGLDCYLDNLAGVDVRAKFRLRWYGEHRERGVVRPNLEIKLRDGLLNAKRIWPAGELTLDGGPGPGVLAACLAAVQAPPLVVSLLRGLRGTVMNDYLRSYFVSRDGRFRLTVDRELEFLQIYPAARPARFATRDPGAVIVELKYGAEEPGSIESFSLGFPLRLTRSSKYASWLGRFLGAA